MVMIYEIDSDSSQFKCFYKEFLKSINDNEINTFGKLTCDEDRIEYVYNLQFVHTYQIAGNKILKSGDTARQAKDDGNRAFQINQYKTALEFYSKGIIKQPQNSPNEKEELSIMFANRSAALYHLKEYQLCLDDIQSALDYSYPSNLRYKVCDRKARCLLALNHLQSAREAFRQTIQALDTAKLTAERRQKCQRDVQIMLAMLDKNKHLTDACAKRTPAGGCPLKEGASTQYPDASSAVVIKESPQLGRYAEARSEILPGDWLLRERPHCAVLLDQYAKSHCFHCFRRCRAPQPCPTCSNVVFCSKECQSTGIATHHATECPLLPSLWASGASVTCMMALRLVTQRRLDHFLRLRPALTRSSRAKVYRSSEYVRVYDLVNHASHRSVEDFLHRTVMAVYLLRCLQTTSYFNTTSDCSPAAGGKLSDNEKFIGGLILRHLQTLQFNSHEVSELVVEGRDKKSVFIGGAVYPTLALFNHSCNPGIVRYHNGTEVVVRAIRTIRSGEMIAENYGPIFTQEERPVRQHTLKTQYWFTCECEACTEDWPTLTHMSTDVMRFRCECGSIVLVPVDTAEFMVRCLRCKQHTNIFKGLKVLQDTDMTFRVARSLMDEGEYTAALARFTELLRLLDSTLAPPFRDYHLCQQELRTCFMTCGNMHVEK